MCAAPVAAPGHGWKAAPLVNAPASAHDPVGEAGPVGGSGACLPAGEGTSGATVQGQSSINSVMIDEKMGEYYRASRKLLLQGVRGQRSSQAGRFAAAPKFLLNHEAPPVHRGVEGIVFVPQGQPDALHAALIHVLQDPVYLYSRDTQRYLDSQLVELRTVLVDLGLAK